MLVKAHALHYTAFCELCGNQIEISYGGLKTVFGGSVPDECFLRRAFVCVCELPSSRGRRVQQLHATIEVH